MPVLTRDVLADSPLADLHQLAGELGIDGFRRLRRDDLVSTILDRRGGDDAGSDDDAGDERPARRRRGGRRSGADDDAPSVPDDDAPSGGRRRRRRSGGEDDGGDQPAAKDDAPKADVEDGARIEGVLQAGERGGSAMVRTGDGVEIYVSAAQVKRCELVDGDRVAGPVRPARRSERFPSLVRIETVNGRSPDDAPGRGDDAPVAAAPERAEKRERGGRRDGAAAPSADESVVRPFEQLAPASDDPTVAAILWLTPIGRGSRVVVTGPHAAGKTEALRRLGAALTTVEDLEVLTVLTGTRPEETGEWRADGLAPLAALDLTVGPDQRTKAIDEAVDQGRRIAAGGGHALLLVDTLDGLAEGVARRTLAAARRIEGGGSLTIVATREEPAGGESTVVALDLALASTGRFPAIDLGRSGTLRPELLVGADGAAQIAAARAEALAPR